MITFEPFPKIPRLSKSIIVTEKIDGTNAQVIITEDGEIGAASRKRLITPEDDNFGFAAWVQDNKEELLKLGPGRHFGEWYGYGIQRGYGLTTRHFALFNVKRWNNPSRPSCCQVVPTLTICNDFATAETCLELLRRNGSFIVPFMNPEGIVIYHSASNTMYKKTFDDNHKNEPNN